MITTKRGLIAEAFLEELKHITVSKGFNTDLYGNIHKNFVLPGDDPEVPMINFTTGTERIVYQPGGFQDRYLQLSIRCYVEDSSDSIRATDLIIADVERVIDGSSRLVLSDGTTIRDMKISLIDTDQGVLAPLGVAEIEVVVEY